MFEAEWKELSFIEQIEDENDGRREKNNKLAWLNFNLDLNLH